MYRFRLFSKILFIIIALTLSFTYNPAYADNHEQLPGPQLVTNAWMFMAGFKADPEALKSMLPEGLEAHPDNHVIINMYTVPDGKET